MILSFLESTGQQKSDLSGTVVSDDSSFIERAEVHLLNTNSVTVTNERGQFRFDDIKPGSYIIMITASGYSSITKAVQVAAETADIYIILKTIYTQLSEVLVTAQKKEEIVNQLPISITAFNSKQIENLRLRNIDEISIIVPNLYSSNPGDKRNVTSIRGITTTSYDPAIATYIDGVNQFSLDSYISTLYDVERIEVLRGPQGTLYGRNAMGGVINIITKQPTDNGNSFMEVSYGNYSSQRYVAGLKAPLIKKKLFTSFSAIYERSNGYFTNTFNNSHFDKQSTLSANWFLKYYFSKRWSCVYNIKYVQNRNEGPFPLASSKDEAFRNPYLLNQNAQTKLVDDILNTSIANTYSGPRFNFSSQTTYQSNYRYYTRPIDADFSSLDAITIINNYGKKWNNVKTVTEELRFSSPASVSSSKNWILGAYFFYQSNPVKQATRFGEDAINIGLPDKNFSLINTTKNESTGISIFGQVTYKLGNRIELTSGLRYDFERKNGFVAGQYQKDPNPEPQFYYRSDTTAKTRFDALSPKIILSYSVLKKGILFISAARGFRAGGFTPLSSDPSLPPLYVFNPEYSTNIELGSKNEFFEKKLQLNITAFYSRISEVQVPTLILPEAVTIVRNTGLLNNKGIELEITGLFRKNFQLNYNLGYTNAQYKKLNISQNSIEVDYKGKRQIFSPAITSYLGIQYKIKANFSKPMYFVLYSGWKYIGKQFFDLANTIYQTPYHVLDTHIGIECKRFSVTFWSMNLSNSRYISYAYDFGGTRLSAPRTFGITVKTFTHF